VTQVRKVGVKIACVDIQADDPGFGKKITPEGETSAVEDADLNKCQWRMALT
jgi:hypothetical protein